MLFANAFYHYVPMLHVEQRNIIAQNFLATLCHHGTSHVSSLRIFSLLLTQLYKSFWLCQDIKKKEFPEIPVVFKYAYLIWICVHLVFGLSYLLKAFVKEIIIFLLMP